MKKILFFLLVILLSSVAHAQSKTLENGDTLVTIKMVYHINNLTDSIVEKQYVVKNSKIIYVRQKYPTMIDPREQIIYPKKTAFDYMRESLLKNN